MRKEKRIAVEQRQKIQSHLIYLITIISLLDRKVLYRIVISAEEFVFVDAEDHVADCKSSLKIEIDKAKINFLCKLLNVFFPQVYIKRTKQQR